MNVSLVFSIHAGFLFSRVDFAAFLRIVTGHSPNSHTDRLPDYKLTLIVTTFTSHNTRIAYKKYHAHTQHTKPFFSTPRGIYTSLPHLALAMDTHTQDRLKELITALARNPNLPNLASAIQTAPTTPPPNNSTPADPPPYPFADEDDTSDTDIDDHPHPISKPSTTINIDASTHVIGSHNTLTVNAPNALAAMVFAALRQAGHAAVAVIDGTVTSRSLALRLNCNVDVRGDGNVVGGGSSGAGGAMKKPEGGAMNANAGATPAMPEATSRGSENGSRKRAADEVSAARVA